MDSTSANSNEEDMSNFKETEMLKLQLEEESRMKEMLEQSIAELEQIGEDFNQRPSLEEDNEWKIRYESQQVINEQLLRQMEELQTKVSESKKALKSIKLQRGSHHDTVNLGEITQHKLSLLQKEKDILEKELRDFEWRLDQESKAYYKANEQRKEITSEISCAKETLSELKHRHKAKLRNTHDKLDNIRADKRILDPKKGPINKAAAVKVLPSINKTP